MMTLVEAIRHCENLVKVEGTNDKAIAPLIAWLSELEEWREIAFGIAQLVSDSGLEPKIDNEKFVQNDIVDFIDNSNEAQALIMRLSNLLLKIAESEEFKEAE